MTTINRRDRTPVGMNRPHQPRKYNSDRNTSLLFILTYVLVVFGHFNLQNVAAQECIDNLQTLFDREAEMTTISTQQQRTYILCPNINYEVTQLDNNYNLRRPKNNINNNIGGGGPPIPLRSNLHIKCGSDGLRANNCFIKGGHLQVDGTAIRGITDPSLDNVIVEGLTFQSSIEHSLWITKPGSITFKQCTWTDHTRSRGPLMLDFYDDLRPSDKLLVRFVEATFHSNRYFGTEAQASMVIANSDQNEITMERTVFHSIDMKYNNTDNRPTYLVESLGKTIIKESCFISNQVAGSPIAVYGNELVASDIHLSGSTSGNQCSFASIFETLQQYQQQKPRCVSSQRPDCPWLDVTGPGTPITPAPPITSPTSPPRPNPTPPASNPISPNTVKTVPWTWPAVEYDAAFGETTLDQSFGGCNGQRKDGVDAQSTSDVVCRTRDQSTCNIGWWAPDERLVYNFDVVTGTSSYDVRVRTASIRTGNDIQLSIRNRGSSQVFDSYILKNVQSGGWQSYQDQFWRSVDLPPGNYELHVSSSTGSINICSVAVVVASGGDNRNVTVGGVGGFNTTDNGDDTAQTDSDDFLLQVPGTYSAMFYHDVLSVDMTPTDRTGNCPYRRGVGGDGGGIDSQINTDPECQLAIQPMELSGSSGVVACNIGWIDAGESLVYDIVKDPTKTTVSVKLRVASPISRPIKVEMYKLINSGSISLLKAVVYSRSNSVRSWTNYQTIPVWTNVDIGNDDKYRIRIIFVDGRVNMCSIAIQ
jgi:hypothetical protein